MKKIYSFPFLFTVAIAFSAKAQDTVNVKFIYTGAVQNWTVPCGVKKVTIKAIGAAGGTFRKGGFGSSKGGRGAVVTGLCNVTQGDVISIVVGQKGGSRPNQYGAGGGGGSYVYDSNTLNLLITGAGGGGGYGAPINFNGGNGGLDLVNNLTTKGTGLGNVDSTGGTGGNGGYGGDTAHVLNGGGAGGAGWFTNGGNVMGGQPCYGGNNRVNHFFGGMGYSFNNGGYGGGGGGGSQGGGAGGGYNGGGGGNTHNGDEGGGGGGGSYLNGIVVGSPSVATSSGNGSVTITYIYTPFELASFGVNQNVTCNGGSNGSITSNATGGTTPYTYHWSDGETTANINNLSAGTYTLTVTDSCGTMVTDSATVTQPGVLTALIFIHTNESCHADSNAHATCSVSGGTGQYTYLWSDPKAQTSPTATGLTAGNYSVTVTDSCGATSTASVLITQPASINIVPGFADANAGCNGSAWVDVFGGTAPYSYLWTGGSTTDTITNQCAGTYCCVITDANGCMDSNCVTINNVTGINGGQPPNGFAGVYPNPNNGICTLTLNNPGIVEIYNVLGQNIYGAKLSKGKTELDISNQAKGIYLYRVLTERGNLLSTGKLIIEK